MQMGRRPATIVRHLIIWVLMKSLIDHKQALLLEHAQAQNPGAQLIMSVLHTAALIDRACAEELAQFDLSEGRLSVLLAAASPGLATPAMLAERLGVTRASITGLVDGLEKQGLVNRISNPADRRSTTIEVTASGREALDRLAPIYGAWLQQLSAGITPHMATHTVNALAAIQSNVEKGRQHD